MGATVAAEGRTILLFKWRPFDSCAAHFYLVPFRIFSAPLVGVSLFGRAVSSIRPNKRDVSSIAIDYYVATWRRPSLPVPVISPCDKINSFHQRFYSASLDLNFPFLKVEFLSEKKEISISFKSYNYANRAVMKCFSRWQCCRNERDVLFVQSESKVGWKKQFWPTIKENRSIMQWLTAE